MKKKEPYSKFKNVDLDRISDLDIIIFLARQYSKYSTNDILKYFNSRSFGESGKFITKCKIIDNERSIHII